MVVLEFFFLVLLFGAVFFDVEVGGLRIIFLVGRWLGFTVTSFLGDGNKTRRKGLDVNMFVIEDYRKCF